MRCGWQLVDRNGRASNVPVVSVSDLTAKTDYDGVIVTLDDFSDQASMPPGLDFVPYPHPVPS